MIKKMGQKAQYDRLASLLFTTRRIIKSRIASGGPADQYGWLHYETLRYIAARRSTSMREIASHLSITAPSASSLIASLVRGGLLRRNTGRDRRAVYLALTPRGRRVLAGARSRALSAMCDVFSALEPRERSALIGILETVVARHERAHVPSYAPKKRPAKSTPRKQRT